MTHAHSLPGSSLGPVFHLLSPFCLSAAVCAAFLFPPIEAPNSALRAGDEASLFYCSTNASRRPSRVSLASRGPFFNLGMRRASCPGDVDDCDFFSPAQAVKQMVAAFGHRGYKPRLLSADRAAVRGPRLALRLSPGGRCWWLFSMMARNCGPAAEGSPFLCACHLRVPLVSEQALNWTPR